MIITAKNRNPFKRPAAATPNFVPPRVDAGYLPEFQPPFRNMAPQFASMPTLLYPERAYPGGRRPKSVPAVTAAASAATAAEASLPAVAAEASLPAVAAKIAEKRGVMRTLPPNLVRSWGIIPAMRPSAAGFDPCALVNAGRRPKL